MCYESVIVIVDPVCLATSHICATVTHPSLGETNIQSHISALPNTITPYTADALLRMAWATVATASRLSVERAV